MSDRLYKHGLPFSKGLDANLDALKDRIEKNKAVLIVLDGGVGEGKTTLGVQVADYIQGRHIDFKTQYAIGGDEFQEKLQICHNLGYNVVIYDEAGDFSKRGALTAFNKRLNRTFDTYRAYRVIVVLILPNFNVLDDHLFNLKIPRMLLNCYNRNSKYGNYRGYSLYRMHYIRHRMNDRKLVIKEYAYAMVQPNFRGNYLDLSHDRSREMDRISTAGKKEILSENILESKGLISQTALTKKLNRSIAWVRMKIRQLKIKPVQTYKQRKYYDGSTLELLAGELGGGK